MAVISLLLKTWMRLGGGDYNENKLKDEDECGKSIKVWFGLTGGRSKS